MALAFATLGEVMGVVIVLIRVPGSPGAIMAAPAAGRNPSTPATLSAA
ncbi:hypothetical protein [Falsiroseomonas sp. HW251]